MSSLAALPASLGRSAASLASFLCAFALTCALVEVLIPAPEVPVISEKLRLLQRQYRDIDVLFVGSSRVMHQIEPRAFDQLVTAEGLPVRSFNLGMDSMWPPESLYVLRELLRHPLPRLKWIFIELVGIDGTLRRDQDETSRVLYWHDRRHTNMAQRAVLQRYDDWHERLPLLWRHEKLWLKQVTHFGEGAPLLKDFLHTDDDAEHVSSWVKDAGYRAAQARTLSGEHLQWFQATLRENTDELQEQDEPLPKSLREELRPILAEFRARGTEPVFFISPGLEEEENYQEAPEGARLLSFARPDLYPELFSPEHFRDRSHLNPKGTALYTQLLARKFLEITRLPHLLRQR